MTIETTPMTGFTTKLFRREEVAEGTLSFHFERPSGFDFEAGQYADVTLIDPQETDKEGDTRSFSIASPPFANELVFVTRMRDTAFKRSLKTLPLTAEVKISPAAGSFTLHKDHVQAAVFLAGGIGITPFLSIARQHEKNHTPQKLHLFYSNRRPEDAAFLETIQSLDSKDSDFRLICTMTEMSKSRKEWKGETSLIDKPMLAKYLTSLQGPIYYIAGPPAMVKAMQQTLVSAGIQESDIRTDAFDGY